MKVNNVSSKLLPVAQAQGDLPVSSNLSFKGNLAQRLTDELVTTPKVSMPKFIELMDKLRVLKGEAGGIIINALGTGLVAPIFIAFNPLSKADEDTKKYTAMRQPVSAVLAVLIQAGLTKPLGQFYDYLSNTGKLGKSVWLNQKNLNSESYLKRKMKNIPGSEKIKMDQQFKAATKFLEEQGTINIDEGVNLSEKDMKSVVDKTIKSYQVAIDKEIKKCTEKQVQKKVDRAKLLINNNNEPVIKDMCNDVLKAKNLKEFNETLEHYLESKNKDIVQVANEFKARVVNDNLISVRHRAQHTIDKINLFDDNVKRGKFIVSVSDSLLEKLNNVKNGTGNFENIIKEIAALGKDDSGKRIKHSNYLEKIAEELSHRVNNKSRAEYAQKIIERIDNFKKAGSDKMAIIDVCQRAYYRDVADEFKNQKSILESMKISAQSEVNIKNVVNTYKQEIKSSKLGFINGQNFIDDTVKTFQKTVDKRFKGYKQITNILVGLFITLPITCHVLNWCYPRFMDIFFPNLSKPNKSEAPEEKNEAQKVKGGK